MDDYVHAFLKGELGNAAKYKKLDPALVANSGPEAFNPFFFFLENVRGAVGRNFDVYWVDGGTPELFSVAQAEHPIVVYSSRFIELVYVFRLILSSGSFDDQF